jgi:polysaccharide export outer membrane protein
MNSVSWLSDKRGRPLHGPLALFLALFLALGWSSAASAQASGPERGYMLGPNDALTVVVYGNNEFNVATRVKPDGSIVMPLIGRVQAEGKTVITLADEITRRLVSGNFLRDPIVNVEITEYNSSFVRVAGKVVNPGLVPLDRSNRVSDILLRAGGVREDGAKYLVIRRAADGQEVRIVIDELARGNDNTRLAPGDTLFVPEAELVFLTGQVNRPGAYPLKPDMTVAELLATAGGVTALGSANKVGLKRGTGKEADADGAAKLQAGDVVNVRERLF